jgi:hypothetical protein
MSSWKIKLQIIEHYLIEVEASQKEAAKLADTSLPKFPSNKSNQQ